MTAKPSYEELEKQVLEFEICRHEHEEIVELLKDEISWRRIMIEESRDGIVILDSKGDVYEANKQFADMLGYSLEEVRKLHVWDWDRKFNKEKILEMIRKIDEKGHHFETCHCRKDGSFINVELSNNGAFYRGKKLVFCVCRDITERKKAAQERENLVSELQDALAEIKALRGILPFCSFCKKIRDDKGYWEKVDIYIAKYFDADVSHSICPECMEKHYPGVYKKLNSKEKKIQ